MASLSPRVPFLGHKMLAFAETALYNKADHGHTSHGGGLAMDAGQSCIASPSVCFP